MRILAIDLETGGLDHRIHGICEIAAVACSFSPTWEGPQVMGRFHALLKPAPGLIYSNEALALNHLSLAQMDRDGVREMEALADLLDFTGQHFGRGYGKSPFAHVVAVAHNAPFDIGFLEAACKRRGVPMPCNFLYRCSCQYFRAWSDARGDDRRSFKLKDMAEALDVPLSAEEQHTATADVEATAICFGKIMRDIARPKLELQYTPEQIGRMSAAAPSLF